MLATAMTTRLNADATSEWADGPRTRATGAARYTIMAQRYALG